MDINTISRKAKTVSKYFSEMNNKLCLHANGVTRVSDQAHLRGTIAAPFDVRRCGNARLLFSGRRDLKDKQLDKSNEEEQITSREINNVSQMV